MLPLSILTKIIPILKTIGAPSLLLSTIFSVTGTWAISNNFILKTLYDDIDIKSVAVVSGINGLFLILYGVVLIMNMISGMVAYRYEIKKRGIYRSFFKCNLAYKTIFKAASVIVLNIGISLVSLFVSIMGYDLLFNGCMFILLFMWSISISYEYHSIGDNLLRRFGSKPKFFQMWDNILAIIEKMFIKKLAEKSFPLSDEEVNKIVDKINNPEKDLDNKNN